MHSALPLQSPLLLRCGRTILWRSSHCGVGQRRVKNMLTLQVSMFPVYTASQRTTSETMVLSPWQRPFAQTHLSLSSPSQVSIGSTGMRINPVSSMRPCECMRDMTASFECLPVVVAFSAFFQPLFTMWALYGCHTCSELRQWCGSPCDRRPCESEYDYRRDRLCRWGSILAILYWGFCTLDCDPCHGLGNDYHEEILLPYGPRVKCFWLHLSS